jgi:hypothetical protein
MLWRCGVVAAEALTENVSAETRSANIPAETLLHPETVRRLACDGGLLTIVEKGNGDPLNVGCKTRCCAAATFALYISSGITFGGQATEHLRLRNRGATNPFLPV